MRYLWLQDFDIFTSNGGAQLTDRAHFIEGIKRGYTISLRTPNTGLSDSDITTGNLLIASNPAFLGHEVFEDFITRGVPYVWFLHDYIPICKYRLYFPMRETCKSCYLKERWLSILLKSKLIIWLSPLHRSSWLWMCPELESVRYHLSPSPINVDLFEDLHYPRQGVIAVESLHDFKGRSHVIKWAQGHPDMAITLIGGNQYPGYPLPGNCGYVEHIPYGEMNRVYNGFESLLHLPQSPGPFDRVVAEAYLAGCKVIGNKNVGALSYSWFSDRYKVRDHLRRSSTEFWEAVERVL